MGEDVSDTVTAPNGGTCKRVSVRVISADAVNNNKKKKAPRAGRELGLRHSAQP